MTLRVDAPSSDTRATRLRKSRWKTGLSVKKAKARLRLTMALIDMLVRIYFKLKGLSPWRVPGRRGTVFILIAAAVFGFCMYWHWIGAFGTIDNYAHTVYEAIAKLFTPQAPAP